RPGHELLLRTSGMTSSRALLAFSLAILSGLSGCGRTQLDTFTDGAPPQPDGGPPDAGACTSDEACSDGLFCNGQERCVDGECVAGAPIGCDDGVDCTDDRCVEATRSCEFVPDSSRCA